MTSFLVVGNKAEARDSLGVLLRSHGHQATVLAEASDAIRYLRNAPVHTVLVVGDGSDVAAVKLRGRLLAEGLATRALVIQPVTSGRGRQRSQRFAIGDHRLGEAELLALLSATGDTKTGDSDQAPQDRGIEALIQAIDVLVGIQELSDEYFRGSSHRAVHLVRSVAGKMKLSGDETLEIVIATLLKDVGKVGIGPGLLEQDSTYSGAERSTMQEHVTEGVRLLEHIDFPWKVLPIVRHHHERYDGTGYPDGLKGPEIPLGARILAAVDAYVAMLSNRPHRACLSGGEAQAELVRRAGTQFDPEVVEILLDAIRRGRVSFNSAEKPVVLIAGSDVEFTNLIAFRLVNEGMEVRAVTSAEEAILKILDAPPHLVLAAVGSEPERVLHLLSEIRDDPELRLLPFAFLTESEDRVFKIHALRQGADDVLVKRTDLEEFVARIESILAREAMRRTADAPQPQRGITGRLENLALPDIFQILNLGLKTARVTLERDRDSGTIWFRSGAATHAQAEDQTGVEACYAMLRWKEGAFCIEHGLESEDTSIEMDTMMIVMEGLRMADESAGSPAELAAE
jgi:HD-GYP domain-containing protein (c-di-GMP phosphodiesterase class II)